MNNQNLNSPAHSWCKNTQLSFDKKEKQDFKWIPYLTTPCTLHNVMSSCPSIKPDYSNIAMKQETGDFISFTMMVVFETHIGLSVCFNHLDKNNKQVT